MPASTVPFHDRSLYKKYYIDCDIVIGRGNIERRERNRSPVQLDGGALQDLAYNLKIRTSTRIASRRPSRQVGGMYGLLQGGKHGYRSEEHTSELQSLMRISYAVFCLQKKNRRK